MISSALVLKYLKSLPEETTGSDVHLASPFNALISVNFASYIAGKLSAMRCRSEKGSEGRGGQWLLWCGILDTTVAGTFGEILCTPHALW